MTFAIVHNAQGQTVCELPHYHSDDLAAPGFTPPPPSQQGYFAHDIHMNGNGNMALVGQNGGGGWAHIYERIAGEWFQVHAFSFNGADGSEHFGTSVGISGRRAVVTAPRQLNASQDMVGAVYFFEYDDSAIPPAWVQVQEIMNPTDTFDGFGGVLHENGRAAIDGIWAAVAADRANVIVGESELTAAGIVHLFRQTSEGWVHAQTIESPTPIAFGHFGASVAMGGGRIIIGEPGSIIKDPFWDLQGRAYVYRYSTSQFSWVLDGSDPEDATLSAGELAHGGDYFGHSVSISGGMAVVGSPWLESQDDAAGRAFVFRRNSSIGKWEPFAALAPSNDQNFQCFGFNVSMSGSFVLVGAPTYTHANSLSGAAYVFQRQGGDVIGEVLHLVHQSPSNGDHMGFSVAVGGDQAFAGAYLKGKSGMFEVGALVIAADLPGCPE